MSTALPDTDLGTAACAAVPHLFEDLEPRAPRRIATAAAVCATCPIAADCRTYGADVKGTGVYGGQFLVGGLPVTPGRCAATGCTTPPVGMGLCVLHYRRYVRTGDPDFQPPTHCACGSAIGPNSRSGGLCKRCYENQWRRQRRAAS